VHGLHRSRQSAYCRLRPMLLQFILRETSRARSNLKLSRTCPPRVGADLPSIRAVGAVARAGATADAGYGDRLPGARQQPARVPWRRAPICRNVVSRDTTGSVSGNFDSVTGSVTGSFGAQDSPSQAANARSRRWPTCCAIGFLPDGFCYGVLTASLIALAITLSSRYWTMPCWLSLVFSTPL
jgi:hypothetical protein